MKFEVQSKCGRGWTQHGDVEAEDSIEAARKILRTHGRRILRVRPAYSLAKFFVYRFPKAAKPHDMCKENKREYPFQRQ